MRNDFKLGICVGLTIVESLRAMVEDLLGVDRWLAWERAHWVHTPWWVWFFPLMVGCVAILMVGKYGTNEKA